MSDELLSKDRRGKQFRTGAQAREPFKVQKLLKGEGFRPA